MKRCGRQSSTRAKLACNLLTLCTRHPRGVMEHTPAVRAALRPVTKDALNHPHFPGHNPRRSARKFFVMRSPPSSRRPQSAPGARGARRVRPGRNSTTQNSGCIRTCTRACNGSPARSNSSAMRLSGAKCQSRTKWVPDQADERYWKHYNDELYFDCFKRNPYFDHYHSERARAGPSQMQQAQTQQRQRRPQSAQCMSRRMRQPKFQPSRRCNIASYSTGVYIEPAHRGAGIGAHDCNALRVPFAVVGGEVTADAHTITTDAGRRCMGRASEHVGPHSTSAKASNVARRRRQPRQRRRGSANAELALHEKHSKKLLDDARAISHNLLQLGRMANKRNRTGMRRRHGRSTQNYGASLLSKSKPQCLAGPRAEVTSVSKPVAVRGGEGEPECERPCDEVQYNDKVDSRKTGSKGLYGSWASGTDGSATASAALAAVRWRKYAADARSKHARVWWTRFERARCGRAPGYRREYSQAQLMQGCHHGSAS